MYQVLHTKIQGHRPLGSRKEKKLNVLNVFTIYGHGGHVGHVTWTVRTYFCSLSPWNLVTFCPEAFEELFELLKYESTVSMVKE